MPNETHAEETQGERVTFNPYNRTFLVDPYPHYADLRRDNPLHRLPSGDTLIVTRYDDVRQALTHPDLSVALIPDTIEAAQEPTAEALLAFARTSLVFTDGSEHKRLKLALRGAFTQTQIRTQLDQAVRRAAKEVVDALPGETEIDLVKCVAQEMPRATMCGLLGIDPEQSAALEHHTNTIRKLLQPRSVSVRQLASGVAALQEATQLLAAHFQKATPGPLMATYFNAAEGQGGLKPDEPLRMGIMTYVAGHETTQSLLANCFASLACHAPGFLQTKLQEGTAQALIQETLRYEAPLQVTTRQAKRAGHVAGIDYQDGDTLLLLLGSANRDAGVFEEPDCFRPSRERQHPNLAMGAGIHACLGSQLALFEAEALLTELTGRYRVCFAEQTFQDIWRPGSAFLRAASRVTATLEPH